MFCTRTSILSWVTLSHACNWATVVGRLSISLTNIPIWSQISSMGLGTRRTSLDINLKISRTFDIWGKYEINCLPNLYAKSPQKFLANIRLTKRVFSIYFIRHLCDSVCNTQRLVLRGSYVFVYLSSFPYAISCIHHVMQRICVHIYGINRWQEICFYLSKFKNSQCKHHEAVTLNVHSVSIVRAILLNIRFTTVTNDHEVWGWNVVIGTLFKDLTMMYRALWEQMSEGALMISQCRRRPWVAPNLQWFWYITKPNLQDKFRSGRWRTVYCR